MGQARIQERESAAAVEPRAVGRRPSALLAALAAGLIGFVAALLAPALPALPAQVAPAADPAAPRSPHPPRSVRSPDAVRSGIPIDVISHGWHTGIVVPVVSRAIELCPPLADFAGFRFVEVGWGDEGFYRSEKISVGTTLRAIGWPTPSVVFAAGFHRPTAEEYPASDVIRLALDPAEFDALLLAIAASFAGGTPLGPGLYGDSSFYRGRGSYYFPNTCNVWTLRTLAAAGVPTTPLLGIRAEAAMAQLARHGTPIRLSPREAKWPYALALAAGVAIALARHRRRARLDPPPERDPELRDAWLAALVGVFATLAFVVLSANRNDWASPATRVAIGGIVAALGGVALVSGLRLRGRRRPRELASALLALLGCALVLSPL